MSEKNRCTNVRKALKFFAVKLLQMFLDRDPLTAKDVFSRFLGVV
jgi:hypothetical protein